MKFGIYFCTILLALTITGLKAQIICEDNEVIPRAIPVFEELQQNFNNVQKFGCNEIDPNERPEQTAYRNTLEFQKSVTQSFLFKHNPALKHDLDYYTQSDGQLHFLGHKYDGSAPKNYSEFYNFAGAEHPSEAPYSNRRIIDNLNSNLANLDPRKKDYLTIEEARAVTEKSIRLDSSVIQPEMGKGGNCFMRAMNVSHEIATRHSSVPVVKVWLTGDFSFAGQEWPYHVAAFAPVLKRGYSESRGQFYLSKRVLPPGVFLRNRSHYRVKRGYHYSREHKAFYKSRLFGSSEWVNESEALARVNLDPRYIKWKKIPVDKSEAIALQSMEPLNSRAGQKAVPQSIDEWVNQFLFQNGSNIASPMKLKVSYADQLAPSRCLNNLYKCHESFSDVTGVSHWKVLDKLSRSR